MKLTKKKHFIVLLLIGIAISLSIIPTTATTLSLNNSWIDNTFSMDENPTYISTANGISDIQFLTAGGVGDNAYWAQIGIDTYNAGPAIYVPANSQITLTVVWQLYGEVSGYYFYGAANVENDFYALICSSSSNCLSSNSAYPGYQPVISSLSSSVTSLIYDYSVSFNGNLISTTTTYTTGSSGRYVTFASYIWSTIGGSWAYSTFGAVSGEPSTYGYHIALYSMSYTIPSGGCNGCL